MAATLLVDTGPGGTNAIGSISLIASGSTTCSPQPDCQGDFQFLAGQFTLPHATALDSVEGWQGGVSAGGGSVAVKIYRDANGRPGTSLFSKSYVVVDQAVFDWIPYLDFNPVLPAGTYWVAFEPVAGSGLEYRMAPGAPNPLAKYAFFGNGNPGYLAFATSLGFRISGT